MAIFTRNGVHDVRGPALEQPFYREHGYTEAPVVVQCYLTLRCGLSCAHCLAARAGVVPADMPLGLFAQLCREAAALGVEEMLLTGGEPLQREDLGGIVDCLRDHGLSWTLNTAACPDPGQQDAIRRYPPGFVAVSLDGPAEVHDAFRGRAGAFAAALASLRFFSDLGGTTVCVGTTVTTRNLPHFEETFALVRKSGAHRWGIHLLIPEGRAQARKDLFPTTRQMRTLLKSVARKRNVFPVSLCDEMGFAGEWESLVRDEAFYCAAGRAMCAVLPDGSVMPCATLDPRHCEGNLAQASLAEIWRTGFAAQRAPRREGKCARCRDWAVCGSGCWLQHTHGTQCFRQLWNAPESLKAAAGIALCLGSLHGSAARAEPIPGVGGDQAVSSTNAFPLLRGSSLTNTPDVSLSIIPRAIFASKSGGHRYRGEAWSEAATQKSLAWLKFRQNADGSWGEPKQQGVLTALATLAFLSHDETQASAPNGEAIGRALGILAQWSTEAPSRKAGDAHEEAVLAWCLAEAYSLTRIPVLRAAALAQAGRLADENATPWHALAWQAQARPELDPVAANRHLAILAGGSSIATDALLRQATQCFLGVHTQDAASSQAAVSAILAEKPEKWAASDQPFVCSFMASRIVATAGGTNAPGWHHAFSRQPVRTQSSDGSFSSWDDNPRPEAGRGETAGMSGADARIYSTALTVLALQEYPGHRPYRLPGSIKATPTSAAGDVIIDLNWR